MKNAKNKNKTAAGWVAAALAFAILTGGLGAGIFILDGQNRANRLQIESIYQQNIYQMSESVTSIEINMSKLMISGENAETAVLLNDTYHHSQSALSALNVLPIDLSDKAATESFLNRLGDWCLATSKQILNKSYASDFENGAEAVFAAAAFNAEKSDGEGKRARLESFGDISEELYIRAKRLSLQTRQAADRFKDGYKVINNLSDGLMLDFDVAETEESAEQSPALIYDGPFSDGQSGKHFKGLEGKEEISAGDAIKKAEEIFKDSGLRSLSLIGETTSPDTYALYGKSNAGDMYVNISKNGGIVLSAGVPCDNSGKKTKINEQEAKQLAQKYAETCGFDGLSPVWYAQAAGFATVNLAPVKNGAVIYPDLVKVKVCRVTGDLKAIEATGFCRCHCQRDLSPAISEIEAQRAIDPRLSITERRLAVIPKNNKEILCYEFFAEYKGMEYFVYIDANTGKQADIKRIIDDEQGRLTR